MKKASPEEVLSFIIESFAERFAQTGVDVKSIPKPCDLYVEGIIDSIGFVRLIALLSEKYQIDLDLDEIDPDQATELFALSEFVSQATENGEDSSE